MTRLWENGVFFNIFTMITIYKIQIQVKKYKDLTTKIKIQRSFQFIFLILNVSSEIHKILKTLNK